MRPIALMLGIKQEFPVPFGPSDGALDDGGSEAERLDTRLYAVAGSAMLFRIAHDTALAHLAFSHFKLRLDQHYDLTVFCQKGNNRRDQQGGGDETGIANRQVELFWNLVR